MSNLFYSLFSKKRNCAYYFIQVTESTDENENLKNLTAAIKAWRSGEGNQLLAKVYLRRGLTFEALQKFNLAIDDYTQVIKIEPSNAIAYFNRGNVHFGLENFDLAISDWRRASELDPMDGEAFYNLGVVYSKKVNLSGTITIQTADKSFYTANEYLEQAIVSYSNALTLIPNHNRALVMRANMYLIKGDDHSAIQDLKKATDLGDPIAPRILKDRYKIG